MPRDETECLTGGTIALAYLLPPEYRRQNRHYIVFKVFFRQVCLVLDFT